MNDQGRGPSGVSPRDAYLVAASRMENHLRGAAELDAPDDGLVDTLRVTHGRRLDRLVDLSRLVAFADDHADLSPTLTVGVDALTLAVTWEAPVPAGVEEDGRKAGAGDSPG